MFDVKEQDVSVAVDILMYNAPPLAARTEQNEKVQDVSVVVEELMYAAPPLPDDLPFVNKIV